MSWVHRIDEIRSGEVVYYLGCTQLVPRSKLSLNNHNIVVHESALPAGRGWSPLTWQILEGKNEIPITLFEAGETVDSGVIYLSAIMRFNGTELVDELRNVQAETSIKLCLEFANKIKPIVQNAKEQQGTATYYPRRKPEDSKLDSDKTIREQFNLLRVVDNDHYPAYFELAGATYVIKITKAKEGRF